MGSMMSRSKTIAALAMALMFEGKDSFLGGVMPEQGKVQIAVNSYPERRLGPIPAFLGGGRHPQHSR